MLRRVGDDELSVNALGVVESIRAAFEGYERALLVNDLDALDRFMWRDPRLVRLGIDDRQDGFDAVSAFRRSQTKQTPPRTLTETVIVTFGQDTAVVTTAFVPTEGSSPGRQSQTWVRMEGRWKIVAAHVSLRMSERRQPLDHKP